MNGIRPRRAILAIALILPSAHLAAAAADTAVITGSISNAATRNLLEGARVEIHALGLSALTDNTGRYVLLDVPGGTHELAVTYIGLDAVTGAVTVGAGQRAVRDFELSAGIYKLAAFKVTGEREGDALAITAQRNASNVKNIVAMDSYGNLPNMSAGEVVMRLPGIAGSPTEEGLAYAFNVRGMAPALNTVTVDGGLMASIGTNRAFELQSITGTMFEQLELIKGHTPDKGADSLGGTINMKSRSPLSMKEKRRMSYSATVRLAPPFTEQVPAREEHRAHPLLTFAYQEVFDILGGHRNLGVAANLFYSENAVGGFRVTNQYENTLNPAAYLWSYQTRENYNNRKQRSVNVKTDYRHSFHTKFSLNLTVNDNIERFRRSNNATAYTGNATTVPNATTSGVIPGYTDKITQVRPIAGAQIDIVNNGPNAYVVKTFMADFGAEHDYGPFQIDYNLGFSRNHQSSGLRPEGGQTGLTHRISNIGWTIDRTFSDTFPRFVQTAGPDVTNAANYRPIANGLNKTSTENPMQIPQARGNVRYKLPVAVPASLKAGVAWREQSVDFWNYSRRWSYLASAPPLPADPLARPYNNLKTGVNLPRWKISDFFTGGSAGKTPANPALWQEDLYFYEANKYSGTRSLSEAVTAGYVMAQGSLGREGWLGRTGYLTGVRTERTDTESRGWVLARANIRSTAAQQLADPAGSARRDYEGTARETKGRYTKSFPSAHLTHDLTANLKARLSWSTSFGRPGISNLLPSETANETAQTVTINNPALLPQTAKNWDFTLDYYFEPVGNLSAGWFKKTIRDYIVTGTNSGIVPTGADNGYNGEYAGFTRLTSSNAGTAEVTGWEFSYQQQFTFLPGLLKGLSGSANYTVIETEGNFGGTATRKTGEVPGFIPKAGNLSLSWRYRGFSTRVLYNYTGDYLTSFNATSPGANLYRYAFKTVNVGVAYQLRPTVTLTCDVANILNEPQKLYQGVPGRTQDIMYNFVTVTFGVSGRF